MKMETISGGEAIRRMRLLRQVDGVTFGMVFVTCDYKRGVSNGLRKVERARIRVSLPKEVFVTDSDLYLPYTDCDTGEPRMCFKKLIRMVCFPPANEWLKVEWFE